MKGQVTLFMILGMLILIGGSIFFFLRSSAVESTLEPSLAVSEQVPIEFDPVKVYIEGCLNEKAIEALKVLGERGGYIKDTFSAGSTPTEGSAISMAADWKIPYWWHMSSTNTCQGSCVFEITPESKLYLTDGNLNMKEQLETYVEENLAGCLNDFYELKSQGYTIEDQGSPDVKVDMLEGSVQFTLVYPVQASKVTKRKISKFVSTVDVDLKNIYGLSVLLTSLEKQYHYLENYLMDLIVGYSGPHDDKLPPISDMVFGFDNTVSWSKQQVKSSVHQDVLPSLNMLQVFGTYNYEPYDFESRYKTEFYNGNMVLPGNLSYSNLAVDYSYLGWEPYFDLNCDGDECKPSSFTAEVMSVIGFQKYDFLYDLSFPVMVTVRDPEAYVFGKQGYTFNFLLEGNIRNNQPMKTDSEAIVISTPSSASMLCQKDKKLSGDISIEVKDSISGLPLDDVQITYMCAGESCIIGKTTDGKLDTKLPICFNGLIGFNAQDHITYSSPLTTVKDVEDRVSVQLDPIVVRPFKVKKALMKKVNGNFVADSGTFTDPVPLDEYDHAILIMERKASLSEAGFTTYAEMTGDGTGEIRIAPGDYEMRIDVQYHGNFTIPPRVEEYDDETVIIPGVSFNNTSPLPNGGIHCETTSDAFARENFDPYSTIVFTVASPNLIGIEESERRINDVEEVGKLDDEPYLGYCYPLRPKNEE